MSRAMLVNTINRYNDKTLGGLKKLKADADAAKKSIDAEVATQTARADIMGKKEDAETALAKAGGKATGYMSANSPLAKPAPRNADGSGPKESCTIDDPTTTGCVTPRMIHSMKEAHAAGFKRYYSCYRPRWVP
ncbi:hypothetical protein GCM10027280_09510 [Micromonospora polyrhachis]|uniref:Uncharacterized protein n=1 Tax=Micromonospora polyrhachis TaxID=1282883 RepID=A0A7W7WP23_9ACTN|nr:hypothetical protein [Micromonospora polyrhachis]MBB4958189.1 hypothetical protein [Micromonospora polyrhachis]